MPFFKNPFSKLSPFGVAVRKMVSKSKTKAKKTATTTSSTHAAAPTPTLAMPVFEKTDFAVEMGLVGTKDENSTKSGNILPAQSTIDLDSDDDGDIISSSSDVIVIKGVKSYRETAASKTSTSTSNDDSAIIAEVLESQPQQQPKRPGGGAIFRVPDDDEDTDMLDYDSSNGGGMFAVPDDSDIEMSDDFSGEVEEEVEEEIKSPGAEVQQAVMEGFAAHANNLDHLHACLHNMTNMMTETDNECMDLREEINGLLEEREQWKELIGSLGEQNELLAEQNGNLEAHLAAYFARFGPLADEEVAGQRPSKRRRR